MRLLLEGCYLNQMECDLLGRYFTRICLHLIDPPPYHSQCGPRNAGQERPQSCSVCMHPAECDRHAASSSHKNKTLVLHYAAEGSSGHRHRQSHYDLTAPTGSSDTILSARPPDFSHSLRRCP
ncbi:hypothetical protein RvY_02693 [Ramazzottius varieornatus]|uniref:Uncharacterized protein n=1 Tax=Ramazzottius varieornatus TaxID=947166 RepID=A0A1D1UKL4_RAMVA|nr:hypothetical protein RvY_02693 [Ramazzottius varieornatus]